MLRSTERGRDGEGGSGHSHRATELLLAWGAGTQRRFELLMPLVHDELRRLARRYMGRERPGPHAADDGARQRGLPAPGRPQPMRWQDRAHFFAMAARLMRRILVDTARRRVIRSAAAAPRRSRSTRRWSSRDRAATTSSRWTTR